LNYNKIKFINWEGCPPGLTEIEVRHHENPCMNWEDCRNESIDNFGLGTTYLKNQYLKHKNSPIFIPYLPVVCKNKKEIYYELVHKLSTPPNGCLFLEDVEDMKNLGLFSA
jgi:hypothetical protein